MMKKTPRKLVLRSETLRALGRVELVRALGGSGSAALPCPGLMWSGDKACEAQAVATTACG